MTLFKKLDADMDHELDRHDPGLTSEVRERRRERNDQIDQSLRRTMRSFTARWLPLVISKREDPAIASQIEEIVRDSWRSARKDMLRAVNRTSYRSALTLYLFAQTPIPVAISEDEELDGISGPVCIQTALSQVQKLRERQQRCHQFDDAPEISTRAGALTNSTPSPSLTQAHMDFEIRAYWAAVMWDTSSSLTLNLRTSLTSGLNGGCSEPAWRVARTFLAGSFHPRTEHWRTDGFEVSDEAALQIINGANVCKLYVWKNITSLKEALREGVDEESVLFVWTALLDSIHIFKTSFRPLLDSCERRLHFLNQLTRLAWYELNLQYYMGILLLVNEIETANRSDLISQVAEVRQDAEQESLNVLKFGIDNTYTIDGPKYDSDTTTGLEASANLPREPVTASFVAIDPYPDRVVDSVMLMSKVINREYRQGKIKHGAYSHLSSTLLKAVGELPQSSRIVQSARENLQRSIHGMDAVFVNDAVVG